MDSPLLLLDRTIWGHSRLGASQDVTGAKNAAAGRTAALVASLGAPLDLAVPSGVLMSQARSALRGLCPTGVAGGHRRSLVWANEIGEYLRGREPLVVHSCLGPSLHAPAYLRYRLCSQIFPVTASLYGARYRYL